jgi:hypothetical protein
MPDTREDDLRQLLTDAIEVQLAALKAGISFWSDWIEQTSEFVQSATKTLSSINTDDVHAKDSLLELVDAGRASLRSMTDLPRSTAERFIEELDKLKAADVAPPSSAAKPSTKASVQKRPRRRVGRAKA